VGGIKLFHRNIICELSPNIVPWDIELSGFFALDVITRDVYIDQMGQPEVYLYILAWIEGIRQYMLPEVMMLEDKEFAPLNGKHSWNGICSQACLYNQ
jgi:hypothetical protein